MLHDLYVAILPYLIGMICAAVPFAIVRFKNSKWWKGLGVFGPMIENMALAAVQTQNRTLVNEYRAMDLPGSPPGKVPISIQQQARKAAVTDTLAAVVKLINPQSAEVVESLLPLVEAAVDKMVDVAKGPDLPEATLALFPTDPKGPSAGRAVLMLFVAGLMGICSGCVSLPDGWAESNADHVKAVSVSATENVYGTLALLDEPVPTLATAGRAGAAQYWADSEREKQERMKRAVKAELRSAKHATPPIKNWKQLADAVRSVCKAAGNDADQILGLLLPPVTAPPK